VTDYARATMDGNQGTPGGDEPREPAPMSSLVDAQAIEDERRAAEAQRVAAEAAEARRLEAIEHRAAADLLGGRVRAGLVRWMAVVLGCTALAVALKHPDAALLLALAAVFALVQSWDVRDRARSGPLAGEPGLAPGLVGQALRVLVPVALPFVAALGYVGLGAYARALPASAAHVTAMQWCWAAAAACLAMSIPQLARLITRALLPRSTWSYTARLSASIALALLLLPVPIRLLITDLMDVFNGTGQPLVDTGALVSQLVGEVLLAAAAVGLWVARDLRATRERLGLGAMQGRHLLIAIAGLLVVIGLNSGMEALEHARFPALWAADQAMGNLIAGDLNVFASVVLGVSAGVGEELLVRGALQPRAGLFWASVLFMAGHVQYTWFGMLTILLLGITLGVVRNRANTTTAIVVHALYDMVAALGMK
jgi:hypothetical protein